jgi:hypothetical protein
MIHVQYMIIFDSKMHLDFLIFFFELWSSFFCMHGAYWHQCASMYFPTILGIWAAHPKVRHFGLSQVSVFSPKAHNHEVSVLSYVLYFLWFIISVMAAYFKNSCS